MYADDLKMCHSVYHLSCMNLIQNDLTRLKVWCKFNKLLFNFNKYRVIRFSRKTNLKIFNYSLGGTMLDNPDSIRDLETIFSYDLSFAEHLESNISHAFRSLCLIQRTAGLFNDTNTLRLLYYTLVRPILEYGSLIWSPYYNTYIDALERPQHKFLRLAAYHSGDLCLDTLIRYDTIR